MDILITTDDFECLKKFMKKLILVENLGINYARFSYENLSIDILIYGIGSGMATYELTKVLSTHKYDLVLQYGRCYALKDQPVKNHLVCIIDDYFGDLGFGSANKFTSIFDLDLQAKNKIPFKEEILENNLTFPELFQDIRKVSGITCNSIPLNLQDISNSYLKNYPDVISREAANFLYICLKENIKIIQLYYVVDRVENLNFNNNVSEEMSEAITLNLEAFLLELPLLKN